MRRKDAIKDYSYFEMEEKFENNSFTYFDLQVIEKKMDELMNEYHDSYEIPFNKIVRCFCDDAKIYYAMNYLFLNGYIIYSNVDIGCDNENFVYVKRFYDDYPEAYDKKKQNEKIIVTSELRRKLILSIINYYPDINIDILNDFTSLNFINFIRNVDNLEIISNYNDYIKYRNELSCHNIRAVFSVARDNYNFFDDETQMRDFYLYNTIIGVEKFFQKFYPANKVVLGDECTNRCLLSGFLYSYAKYMLLRPYEMNNSIIFLGYKNDICIKINKLLDSGRSLDEIALELDVSVSEILYLLNISKDIVSLDEVDEEDISNYRLYDEYGQCSIYKNAIYGGYDEDFSLDDIICEEENTDFVFSLLNLLDDKDRFVLMYHYGLDGGVSWTYDKIGRALGVSRQRVQQIDVRARKFLKEYVLSYEKGKSYKIV